MSEKKNQEFLESMELIIEYAKKIANGENIEITKAEWNNGKETNPDRVAHILTLEAGTRRSEVFMRRDSIESGHFRRFKTENYRKYSRNIATELLHVQRMFVFVVL